MTEDECRELIYAACDILGPEHMDEYFQVCHGRKSTWEEDYATLLQRPHWLEALCLARLR